MLIKESKLRRIIRETIEDLDEKPAKDIAPEEFSDVVELFRDIEDAGCSEYSDVMQTISELEYLDYQSIHELFMAVAKIAVDLKSCREISQHVADDLIKRSHSLAIKLHEKMNNNS